ncbi:MAG: hypothetical protein U0230_00795 [Polyangiales bacterium]
MKRRELFQLLALSSMATALPGGLAGCTRSVTVGGVTAPTFGSRVRVQGASGRIVELDVTSGIATVFDEGVETAELELADHAYPSAVALANDGRIAVVDASARTVTVFDATLRAIATLGRPELEGPSSAAFDAHGTLLVADSSTHRVVLFGPDLARHGSFGGLGTSLGELNGPRGLAVDASRHVHVVDTGNARIQVFDSRGALASRFGTYGRGDGQFVAPRSICVDGIGRVHVADPVRGDVQVFEQGSLVDTFVPPRGRPIAVAATLDGGVHITVA